MSQNNKILISIDFKGFSIAAPDAGFSKKTLSQKSKK